MKRIPLFLYPLFIIGILCVLGMIMLILFQAFGVYPCWAWDGGVINNTFTREMIVKCA